MQTPLTVETSLPKPDRRIFCNRTLNLRATKAVGFDMDYTLIHYRVSEWEGSAYRHARGRLLERGWPLEDQTFDADFASLGLIVDIDRGNIIKANRFGYVRRACHGTQMLSFSEQRRVYARELIDLSDTRWRFMNTLFALSEANLFAQCVDLFDAGKLPDAHSYKDVYRVVRACINEAHMMGELKAEIMAEPDRFVELDKELPLMLMDLRHAGKKVLLITNSEFRYTNAMMTYAFDRFLPKGTWRDLFDLKIVAARKPDFFNGPRPVFELVDDEGLLRPAASGLSTDGIFHGGDAGMVESLLALRGEEILYVGDHIFSDVNVSKKMHRWRTGLVVRELEDELVALDAFASEKQALSEKMVRKEVLEHQFSQLRLHLQRLEAGYGPQVNAKPADIKKQIFDLRAELVSLDETIAPQAKASSELCNARWGLIMRAGNDKSHLARQIEKNADIYMSRVSNFLSQTPFVYLRSPRGSLPHDLD